MARPPRSRRRAFRPSEAENYDRSADTPEFHSAFNEDGSMNESADRSGDATRSVQFEDDAEDTPTGDAFWREQIPPHFGGES